ncbi:uncharacterized protein METZ01_LOCUS54362 [marine metagenome]|uniref:Uncharacterized protein n=1 Tax=marine metagenome TaxID=408172 RepID=A0A381SDX1_9ZZZZ
MVAGSSGGGGTPATAASRPPGASVVSGGLAGSASLASGAVASSVGVVGGTGGRRAGLDSTSMLGAANPGTMRSWSVNNSSKPPSTRPLRTTVPVSASMTLAVIRSWEPTC